MTHQPPDRPTVKRCMWDEDPTESETKVTWLVVIWPSGMIAVDFPHKKRKLIILIANKRDLTRVFSLLVGKKFAK